MFIVMFMVMAIIIVVVMIRLEVMFAILVIIEPPLVASLIQVYMDLPTPQGKHWKQFDLLPIKFPIQAFILEQTWAVYCIFDPYSCIFLVLAFSLVVLLSLS